MIGKYKNIKLSFGELEKVSSIEYSHFLSVMTNIYPNSYNIPEWDSSDYSFDWIVDYDKPSYVVNSACAQIKWETGGYSGGSCWNEDDEGAEPYETGLSCDYDLLPKIVCSILKTADILIVSDSDWDYVVEDLKDFLREDTDSVHEYYGNSTDYGLIYIPLRDLYEYLIKTNLM